MTEPEEGSAHAASTAAPQQSEREVTGCQALPRGSRARAQGNTPTAIHRACRCDASTTDLALVIRSRAKKYQFIGFVANWLLLPKKLKRQITNIRRLEERYDISKVLGDGNFAIVKQCKNKENGHEYALKIIDKSKMKVNLRKKCYD